MTMQKKPGQPQSASLTVEAMRVALPKLKRRLEELKTLDPSVIQDITDEKFESIELKLDDTLVSIFGNDTVEYNRYHVYSLYMGPRVMGGVLLDEIQNGYREGRDRAITKVQAIISIFEENLSEGEESSAGHAVRAIGDLDLHPDIRRAIESLFRTGHYANAVEDACKVLDNLVKMRANLFELSGTDLMLKAFSVNKPVLKFNHGATESDKSE